MRFITLLLAALLLLDFVLDAAEQHTGFTTEIVDIQTPATLYAKLDYLRRFDGIKIVVLGDSVAYGRALADAGDADWRLHTLSAQLQDRLDRAGLKRRVLVLNVGMNGALPMDIEKLAELIVPIGVDKLVLDITLRSFSADFAAPAEQISRPWLSRMSVGKDGRYVELATNRSLDERLEAALREFFVNHWTLYRLRDFVQWRVLNGEPAAAARNLRDRLNLALGGGEPATEEAAFFTATLLKLKAKNRHATVSLAPDNPQRAAFDRTLHYLVQARQPTVIFYATEDAAQMKDIMETERYLHLLKELQDLMPESRDGSITYVPPVKTLQPAHYIDYVHPNKNGYALLVDAIVGAVTAGLN